MQPITEGFVTSFNPRGESDPVIEVMIESIDKYLQDMMVRDGVSSTEAFIRKIDAIRQNFSPVTSFSNENIDQYISRFREDVYFRELLFHVWVSVNVAVGQELIDQVSQRFLSSVPFIDQPYFVNHSKDVRNSPFFVDEFIGDLPDPEMLTKVYKTHRWLFIPALIAMYYDLNIAEIRLRDWYKNFRAENQPEPTPSRKA